MNALAPITRPGGDFGPDRLSPRRLRELAQLLEQISDQGMVEYDDLLWNQEDRDRLHEQLAEAGRALDALAEAMVRGEVRR
jgi:hypothetical protein